MPENDKRISLVDLTALLHDHLDAEQRELIRSGIEHQRTKLWRRVGEVVAERLEPPILFSPPGLNIPPRPVADPAERITATLKHAAELDEAFRFVLGALTLAQHADTP